MSGITVLLICFLFLLLFFYRVKITSDLPPGPVGFPVFGSNWYISKLSKQCGGLHHAFQFLAQKHRTDILGFSLGSHYFIILFKEKYLKLLTSHENLQGRPDTFFTRLRTMGVRRGITILDGPIFHAERKFVVRHLTQLGFRRDVLKKLIKTEFKHILEFIESKGTNICISKVLTPAVEKLKMDWCFSRL